MNVDLGLHGFDQFTLRLWPDLAVAEIESVLAQMGREVVPGPNNAVHAYITGGFKKNAVDYHVFASIVSHDDPPEITLRYTPLTIESSRKSALRKGFTDIRTLLRGLSVPCFVIGSAACDISPGWKAVVSLPLITLHSSNNAFDQIRGVRTVKIEEGKETETTIMDMNSDGSQWINLQVNFHTTLSPKTPSQALTLLSKLRSKMVLRADEDEAES